MEEVKYKYIAYGRTGSRQVFPANTNTLIISYEKKDENPYHKKVLKGKMTFKGDDFSWLYTFEKSMYRCDPIQLIIQKNCSGVYADYFTGRILLNSASWDLDQGFVEVEIEEEDKYTCYNDNKDVEYNLFAIAFPNQVVDLLEGTIETLNCNGDSNDPQWCSSGDQNEGWLTVSYRQYNNPDPLHNSEFTWDITWAREVVYSATPLELPWISIGNDQYARRPATYGVRSYSTQYDYGYSYQYGGSIDHGMKLLDALQSLLNQACPGKKVKSKLFNWNQDIPQNIDYVTGKASKIHNLLLFQKSDVKRPNDTANANRAMTTIDKMVKDICNTFQCQWDIDDDGDFIIEHVSFFQKGVGLNLIDRFDSRLRVGMNKYSYDVDKMPRREIFTMMDSKYQFGDFAGTPIVYTNSCVGKGDKEDKDWQVNNWLTDVSFVLNNPASDSALVSDEGFVLIACNATNKILTAPPIGGGYMLNNVLSWAHLHQAYWKHNRIFSEFKMNGAITHALSVIPTKKQAKINVSICCEDFDPANLVRTDLGDGIVSDASLGLYSEMLELTLLYPADQNLSTNTPPVATNDNIITFVGLPVEIDVLANDNDPDGVVVPSTLELLSFGNYGVAQLVNGKIKYTPNPGYVGPDIVVYRIRDNWGEYSNNGIVYITVNPGSPVPIAVDDPFTIAKNKTLYGASVLANDTGDGNLSVVAETKPTAAGGTVTLAYSGTFVYTPPTGFTGVDGFDYTMKDSNNNTDTGHVSINVIEAQTVYVRYSESNFEQNSIHERCSDNGSLGHEQLVGFQTTATQLIEFFSNAAGTVPLDVTNYALVVKLKLTRQGTYPVTYDQNINASGTKVQFDDIIISYNYDGCSGSTGERYDDSYSLVASPDYFII